MAFKSWLAKLVLSLFKLLFIYPAILFAILVLGFTDAWKSGVVMLVSALLIRLLLRRDTFISARPVGKAKPKQPGGFPGFYNEGGTSPPQLSDIYFDLASHLKEQEEIIRIIREDERRSTK
ncbi:hypothetical protein [Paenibacillus silvisoli]|uniref:hypothetical protein n=1 Tax=Paenibacillus silvisoli TaxID=3110539 RepID=UPI002805437B|nr:hypothetical protein [Paenibacillus silvisoli]